MGKGTGLAVAVIGGLAVVGIGGLAYALFTRNGGIAQGYGELVEFRNAGGPELAEGAPDGLYASLTGANFAGDNSPFITLQVFDTPTLVSEIRVWYNNPYGYKVTNLVQVKVSSDGNNWTVISQRLDLPSGDSEISWVTDLPVKYVRLEQELPGVTMRIDAVQAIAA